MPVVIDATVGGASANSFVTLAECTTYMSARLNSSAFDSATTDSQNRALVSATTELNTLNWLSRKTVDSQALQWPRWFCPNPDAATFALNYYLSTVIPDRVKNATCELAFQYLVAGTTDIAALDPNVGVIEKTVDVLTTRWQPYQRPKGLSRFPSVMRFIKPLLVNMGVSIPLVRG